MTDNYTLRPFKATDLDAMLELMPQLADFNVPENRNPEDLWRSDAQLLRDVAASRTTDSFAEVVVDEEDAPLGLVLLTLREELLSHAPSAHLEAIVVSPRVRGQGLGERLLKHAETCALAKGATSLTLHVFQNNRRARGLYEKQGYDSELIRAIKWLR